jgi:hypothetical protein
MSTGFIRNFSVKGNLQNSVQRTDQKTQPFLLPQLLYSSVPRVIQTFRILPHHSMSVALTQALKLQTPTCLGPCVPLCAHFTYNRMVPPFTEITYNVISRGTALENN